MQNHEIFRQRLHHARDHINVRVFDGDLRASSRLRSELTSTPPRNFSGGNIELQLVNHLLGDRLGLHLLSVQAQQDF